MLNLCNTSVQIATTFMPPIRDVDWHSDKSDIVREPQRRAALGQRLGTAALSGQECA